MTTSRDTIDVFLADDHTMFREGLAALVAQDPQIRVVGQSGGGLNLLEEIEQSQPDVVVLDITLPGVNGLDVCLELTRKSKDIGVVIVTVHRDEQLIARALEYGASAYLLKGAPGAELIKAVRAAACGELYLGPGIPKSAIQQVGRGREDPYEQLTMRERQVLQLIAEGKTNRQIAQTLDVAVKTVDTHRLRLMRKLGVHDQASLVKHALRKGLTSLD